MFDKDAIREKASCHFPHPMPFAEPEGQALIRPLVTLWRVKIEPESFRTLEPEIIFDLERPSVVISAFLPCQDF